MKFWKILAASFAALALFTGCSDDENDETIPTLEISVDTLTFDATGGSSTFTVTSNRDWTITSDEWLSADPASGTASDNPVTVTVTALSNTSTDRTGSIKVATSFDYKTLTVTQTGEGGSAEASVVYKNDFDKEEATQTYGTSGQSWPYLDEFEGWKNEDGTGIASVSYTYSGMSVRSNSASNGQYSNYEGSGVNNLFFGKNAYIKVKEITLSSAVNYTLSFGTEKYVYGQDDNTFNPEEFHVYISNDTTKWVELTYTFPGDYQNGKWDLASTTFTVPSGTSTLSIYIGSDIASSHRLDDLTLVESSEAGTEIDFSTGTEIDNGSESEDTPSGSGTLDDPYNPAMAAEVASALESGATTDSNVYIKGKISSIKYEFSAQYGTATFNISEDGTTSSLEFQCYSVYYLENKPWVEGNTQIQVGDDVVIYGKLTNYNGTPETASKQAYIYSLNGNTENEVGDTEYAEKTISEMIDAAEDSIYVQTQEEVFVAAITKKGYVAYDGTKAIYVYENGTPSVAIGDKVTFTGQVVSYYGMPEIINPTTTTVSTGNTVNYPEANDITSSFDSYTQSYAEYVSFTATIVKSGNYTNFQVDGASTYVGSLSQPLDTVYNTLTEGKKVKIYGFYNGLNTNYNLQQVILVKYEILDDGTGGGDTGEIIDATVAEFIAAEESTSQLYRVKGVITSIEDASYGNIYIADGTDTVYIYGVKANATAGNQSFSELGASVGDTITVVGYRGSYNGTIEMKNGYCEELLPGSGSGGDTGDDEFASDITWTSGTNAYVSSGTVNGVSNVTIYKLGKNNSGGTATLSIPQGVNLIRYYGVSWNSEEAKIMIEYNGNVVYSQTLRTNSGAKGKEPYTLTVTDEDCYTINLQDLFGVAVTPAEVDVTIKTDAASGERALLFGMQAFVTGTVGVDVGDWEEGGFDPVD